MMITMLQDLIRHKVHADAALLAAIGADDVAARDPELMKLAHHMLVANRFWLSLALGEPFLFEQEVRQPETAQELVSRYRETEVKERDWIAGAGDADLENWSRRRSYLARCSRSLRG